MTVYQGKNMLPPNRNRFWHSYVLLFLAAFFLCSCSIDKTLDVDSLIKQGDVAFTNGEYDKAISVWTDALKTDAKKYALLVKIASAYQKQLNFDQSTKFLESIIVNQNAPIDVYLIIAQNHIMTSRIDEAKAVFKMAKRRRLTDYRLIVLEGDFETLRGRLQEGEQLYRKAITLKRSNADAYFKLASNLIIQNRPEIADECYRGALSMNGKRSSRYWLHKAEYLVLTGDTPGAEISLQEALKNDPHSIQIKFKMAQLYQTTQNYNAIVDLFINNNTLSENEEIQKLVVEALINSNKYGSAYSIIENYDHFNDDNWLLLLGKHSLFTGKNAIAVSYLNAH